MGDQVPEEQIPDEVKYQKHTPVFSHSRVSPDSKRVAFLQVFPNRRFRDGWKKHANIPSYDRPPRDLARDMAMIRAALEGLIPTTNKAANIPRPPQTATELKDASSGWSATYRVFSIESSQPLLTTSIEINLSTLDVALCLRQGLCADDQEWSCSFPLSISPELDMFTVLHNLICVRNGKLFQQVISLDGPITHRWDTWSKVNSDATREHTAVRSDIYRYQFTWSPDGKYLLFHDLQMQPLSWVNNGTCAVVIGIANRRDCRKRVGLVNYFTSTSFSSGFQDCQFHPTETLLLFRDEAKTYLWRFLKDKDPMVLDLDGGPEGQAASLVDRVSFTACGEKLAVSRLRAELPDFVALSDFLSML
ncbi:unnamed protein product [Clonostachys byssicola]|uniref:Uncharacterized protein n=1 Tax=Clonostachys byssicola TaxID=160290 RepID=A0A9N9UC10_9HYPO|nr:unnamed protein product [Clonostachys byssicola]